MRAAIIFLSWVAGASGLTCFQDIGFALDVDQNGQYEITTGSRETPTALLGGFGWDKTVEASSSYCYGYKFDNLVCVAVKRADCDTMINIAGPAIFGQSWIGLNIDWDQQEICNTDNCNTIKSFIEIVSLPRWNCLKNGGCQIVADEDVLQDGCFEEGQDGCPTTTTQKPDPTQPSDSLCLFGPAGFQRQLSCATDVCKGTDRDVPEHQNKCSGTYGDDGRESLDTVYDYCQCYALKGGCKTDGINGYSAQQISFNCRSSCGAINEDCYYKTPEEASSAKNNHLTGYAALILAAAMCMH